MTPDMDNLIYKITPPDDYLEVIWGIKLGEKPTEYHDWITDELKPEQVVQIFDSTKNNQGFSGGGR